MKSPRGIKKAGGIRNDAARQNEQVRVVMNRLKSA
jgi:hypothetical protein